MKPVQARPDVGQLQKPNKTEEDGKMKKRHSCTKERLCGCVRTRLDKTIIDTVSLDKCAAHLPIGISRTFCGMTNQYVFFEKARPQ